MATPRKHKPTPKHKTSTARLPYLGYVRVSRIGGRSEKDGYISKPEQRRVIAQLAHDNGVEVGVVLEEENVSGGSLDRPEFQRALAMIRNGEAAGIIVKTLDRFSRNTGDGLSILDEIESHGGRLIPGDGPISGVTADARMTATLRFGMADRELGLKKEQFARTVERAVVENGIHLRVPYGYQRGTWKGHARRLIAHPDEAPVVRRMYEMRKAGHGWGTIATTLNDEGIQPRSYRRRRGDDYEAVQGAWTHKTVRAMVMSEVYLGHAFNGDHRYENAHEPLVKRALWLAANAHMVTRKGSAGRPGKGKEQTYLLTGLVRCASCGGSMIYNPKRSRGGAYYVCFGGKGQRATRCVEPVSVPAGALEAYVEAEFLSAAQQIAALAPTVDDADGVALEVALQDADEAFVAAFDRAASTKKMTTRERALIERRLDERRAALAAAEAALAKWQTAQRGVVLPVNVAKLPTLYPRLPLAERRHLIGLVFACVAVRRAVAWREDIEQRCVIVPVDAIPEGVTVIEHVVALDWKPAVPRIQAS